MCHFLDSLHYLDYTILHYYAEMYSVCVRGMCECLDFLFIACIYMLNETNSYQYNMQLYSANDLEIKQNLIVKHYKNVLARMN